MSAFQYTLAVVAVVSLVTGAIRFSPFLIFRKRTPGFVLYLGKVLPFAIIGMLVVYCLKDINFMQGSRGIPEAIAVLATALIHKWKHNTLLSILIGTILYMIAITYL